jgi:hypothetical protein
MQHNTTKNLPAAGGTPHTGGQSHRTLSGLEGQHGPTPATWSDDHQLAVLGASVQQQQVTRQQGEPLYLTLSTDLHTGSTHLDAHSSVGEHQAGNLKGRGAEGLKQHDETPVVVGDTNNILNILVVCGPNYVRGHNLSANPTLQTG